jgi:hypothetical protein
MNKIIPFLGFLVAASPVYAEPVDANQIYFGVGIGFNDVNNSFNRNDNDAVGFQVFAGLPLHADMGSAALALEVGYMDTGDFDSGGNADGVWSTAVASLPLSNNLKLLGRLGYDFGDDDGVMIGAGIGFPAGNKMDVRLEYVIRDNIDSLQVNLVFRQ